MCSSKQSTYHIPFSLHSRTLSAFKLFSTVLQRSLVLLLLPWKSSPLHLREFASAAQLPACRAANLHQGCRQHSARNLLENLLLLSQAASCLNIHSFLFPFSATLPQIREFSRELGKSRNILVQVPSLPSSLHQTFISESCLLASKAAKMLDDS